MSEFGNAIVTGGGSGIGRAFCHALVERGWNVAVADINVDAAEHVTRELGGRAIAHALDVADPNSWHSLRTDLEARWPQLDLLVNNAGVLVTGELGDASPGDLAHIVEVNLLGVMHGTNTMVPWLRKSQSTVNPRGVINMASIFAAVAPPGFAAYNATKAGVIALTESLRGELKPYGLNATAVLPGVTPTQLFSSARLGDPAHSTICDKFVAASKITAEQVAREALAGAARGQLHVVVGGRAKLYWRLKRLAPQWLVDRVGRQAAGELRSAHSANPTPPVPRP
ncbi:SDR family NAD(P)-dependent oxidoreductase [Aeoliella sp. SH292]|uniref:SDR family NAD(P)-dependent oxidoreductase n=1 Tax=Aeoliella sp. SH292 TaxID=3454464 RepID=UPI003F9C3296